VPPERDAALRRERLADPQCRAVRQHDLDAAIGFGRHIARQRRRQRLGCGEHPHRQEGRLAHQLPAPLGVPPLPQQAATDLVPTRHLSHRRAWLIKFSQDPQLLLHPPATTTLNPSDDLHKNLRP
jgi:hypothetical protein